MSSKRKKEDKKLKGKSFLKFRIPKPLLKIYLVFVGSIFILFAIFSHGTVRRVVIAPFSLLVAKVSGLILSLFEAVTVSGRNISFSGSSVQIIDDCNGMYATAILLAAVVAYPSKFKEKLMGLGLGFVSIFIINNVRIASLCIISKKYPQVFDEVHIYVWEALIIGFAILVWDFWAKKIVKSAKIQVAAVSS